jgi:hypothetical protein
MIVYAEKFSHSEWRLVQDMIVVMQEMKAFLKQLQTQNTIISSLFLGLLNDICRALKKLEDGLSVHEKTLHTASGKAFAREMRLNLQHVSLWITALS